MNIADKINWIYSYLDKRQFDNISFNSIVEAYINHCKNNNIDIGDESKVYRETKACLDKLEADGHVHTTNFSIDDNEQTYRKSITLSFSPPKYYLPTQEEIETENFAKEMKIREAEINRRIDRDMRRAKRLEKAKQIFLKYWFAIVTGVIVAVLGILIEKFIN